MDAYSTLYGFNVPVAALGLGAAISSIIGALYAKQHRWQYTFIFLGGAFCLAEKLLYILVISGMILQSTSQSQVIASTMAYIFFDRMFIPLVYCVFFRTCHTAIVANQPMIGNERSKKGLGAKLFSAYVAYAWLLALVGTNAAYCALADIATTTSTSSYSNFRTMNILTYINIFGVWLFALLALIQILFAYQALRPYLSTLIFYLCAPLIGSGGITALYFLPSSRYGSLIPIIVSFVVEMIGLLGLLFALWALARHWPSEDNKPLAINQPSYIYVPAATGHQSGLYSYSPATGSSPQVQYQVPPVVQIPPPQYQQAGQYPIAQVPIGQSGQYGHYSGYH